MRYFTIFALCTLLGACATVPPVTPVASSESAGLTADASFAPPTEAIRDDDLFALTPEMKAFLRTPEFRVAVTTKGKERALAEALYRNDALQLTYDTTVTRPAGATFASRSGNCLALVIMTAAFAQAMDMTTTFQNVLIGDTWTRGDALYMSNLHVNVIIGHRVPGEEVLSSAAPLLIDFLPPAEVKGFRTRILPQATIVAMYLNNRAAEELDAGRIDNAYWWARKATQEHPDFVTAFNTLGVVLERRDQVQLAERAFRVVLAHDPTQLVAMYNLMDLLRHQQRMAEADDMAQRIALLEKDPPFVFFNRGMVAMQAGDYQQARAMFAKEVERAPYNDEFHFWLGIAELRLGNQSSAQRQIALARENSSTIEARNAYSAKLAHLRAAGRSLQ